MIENDLDEFEFFLDYDFEQDHDFEQDSDFKPDYDFESDYNFEQDYDFEQDKQNQNVLDDSNEEDNNNNENLPQSHWISPTWKYFNDQTFQHPGRPVCCKCQSIFGKDTGISTLKWHLLSVHKIKIDNVKNIENNQSILNFKRTDPWPNKEKKEHDIVVVEWIIGDA